MLEGSNDKYKAIKLSRSNSITNNFFLNAIDQNVFVNNKMNCHVNQSVSCQTSSLQMITT